MNKRTNYSKTEKTRTPITVCIIITVVIFAIFTARLIDWQLIHGDEYKQLANRSTSYTVTTDATRGEILDKNGNELVANITHYKVIIDKLYVDENTLDETILFLIDILNRNNENWVDTLPISVLSDGSCKFKSGYEDEIKFLKSDEFLSVDENATADQCYSELLKLYNINENYSLIEKRNLVSVHYNMEITDYSSTNPYVLAEDISHKTVSVISENTQGISGIDVQTYKVREAVDADLAPHILGALGSVTEEEYKNLKAEGKEYSLSDEIGKFGIELAFEDMLRGTGGTKIIKKNSDGSIVDTVETINATPGNTVYLTLDSDLQKTAVKSLAENVKAAKEYGISEKERTGKSLVGEDCEAGAVVMLSVKDFSVLAAASYPTFDLNRYSEYGDYYIKLAQNENSPMYNRISVGSFACGSVFKPCVAGAALEEKIITKKDKIYCKQDYDYYPTNVVHCMHYHGDENVTGAISQSCNYFFAETGRLLGIDTMYLYAEKFGLGEYTGLEIEESKGTLAGRDSKTWEAGNTVSAAIGQSDNAFTPVQLASYVATIANNGVRLETHLVDKVTNYERTKVIESHKNKTLVDDCGISQKNLKTVQKAMLEVTQSEDGTANYMFGNYGVKVAAKTGTAENAGSDHTTFICYAPFEKPEVAVAVVIENGARGQFSMQIAKDLLDEYFKNKM